MIFSVEKLTPNIKYGEPPFQSTSLKDIRISPTDPWKPVNIMIKKGDSLFVQTSGGQRVADPRGVLCKARGRDTKAHP